MIVSEVRYLTQLRFAPVAVAISLLATVAVCSCALPLEHGRLENDLRIQPQAAQAASDQQSDLMYELLAGEMAGHSGVIDQAVDHYVRAATLSTDPKIAERATQIALYGATTDQALVTAHRWADLAPKNPEAERMLGLLYLRAGKPELAVERFEQVIAAESKDGKGYYIVAATLAGEKNDKEALAVMHSLVGQHAEDPEAHLAYAGLALQFKQAQDAIDGADQALKLNSKLTEARVLRARAYGAAGDYERAAADMKQAAAESGDREIKLGYAKLLIQTKRYEPARAEFRRLLATSPKDPDLLYALGLLDLQEKHYDEAKDIFQRMLASGERVNESRFYLARTEEDQGHQRQAMTWYGQVEGGSYYVDSQVAIASLKLKLDGIDAARTHLRELRRHTSEQETAIQYYLAEGELLRTIKQYQPGLDLFNEALQQFPGNSDLLYARALMAEKLNRVDVLEADLRSILREDPDNVSALNALGFTLADRNQHVDEALGYIQRALKARPDDPAVIDSMGWVLFRLGQYPESERFLRKAYTLMNDGEIAGHLSEVIWQAGRHEEARSLIDKAIQREPDQNYLRALHQRYSN